MTLGARILTTLPTNKLDLKSAAGTVASVGSTSADEYIVNKTPTTRQRRETVKHARGPLSAKSSNDDLVSGKDRRGVILPNVPICKDGSGVGNPISIFSLLAVIKCATSCMKLNPNTPKNIGTHEDKDDKSFLFTIASKTVGFKAYADTA